MRREVMQAAGRDLAVSEALRERVAKLRREHPAPPAELVPGYSYGRTLKLRITGVLLEDARPSTQPGSGVAELTVVLHQAGDDLPVVATRRYDATPTSHMVASALARRLRAGAVATVHGTGHTLCHHPRKQPGARRVLRLTGVFDIEAAEGEVLPLRKDLA